MSNQYDLDFSDFVETEVPVKVKGVDYTLKQATGASARKFDNQRAASVKWSPDGKFIGFKDAAGLQPYLISMCLFDENGKNVPERVIESWPSQIQKQIYDTAIEISKLNASSDVSKMTVRAFSRDDSPVALETVREWLEGLDKEYKDVKMLFSPTDEELAKNSQETSESGVS